jgi:hypothetical protein
MSVFSWGRIRIFVKKLEKAFQTVSMGLRLEALHGLARQVHDTVRVKINQISDSS